jgi:3-oxoacyl-[acyl-carrier protein] reductase
MWLSSIWTGLTIWIPSWHSCNLCGINPKRPHQEEFTMFDLSGNIALITGASGGIGAAIARALHTSGATVVLHGTRAERLAELAGELGDHAHAVTANLSSREEVAGLVDAAAEAAGAPVSILVNNAGITRDNLTMRMKDEEWDDVLNVNMTAAMMLARASLRSMMKARHGRIISVSSIVGVTGNPGQANYAASKAGMIGFSKALAAEVASRGITVNAVAPGFIATPMTDALGDAQQEALLGRVPMGRLGSAEEVAAAVTFLASGEASYITGSTIHVNGGMAML